MAEARGGGLRLPASALSRSGPWLCPPKRGGEPHCELGPHSPSQPRLGDLPAHPSRLIFKGKIAYVTDLYLFLHSYFDIDQVVAAGGEGIVRRIHRKPDPSEFHPDNVFIRTLYGLGFELAVKQTAICCLTTEYLRVVERLLEVEDENLCRIRGVVLDGTNFGVVMEYLGSADLSSRLAATERIDQTSRDMIRAVAVLHGHGISHRDIKLENFMHCAGHVVLVDFGRAQLMTDLGADRGTSRTYGANMAPEVALGDWRAPLEDEWGLGVALSWVLSRWAFGVELDMEEICRACLRGGAWPEAKDAECSPEESPSSSVSTEVPCSACCSPARKLGGEWGAEDGPEAAGEPWAWPSGRGACYGGRKAVTEAAAEAAGGGAPEDAAEADLRRCVCRLVDARLENYFQALDARPDTPPWAVPLLKNFLVADPAARRASAGVLASFPFP